MHLESFSKTIYAAPEASDPHSAKKEVPRIYNDTVKSMSQKQFNDLSQFIIDHCGIKMPQAKKIMLESRLQKRLRSLGMTSFAQYCEFLFGSPEGAGELVHMIDAVTTNKTDFFREPVHFQYLAETGLPEFMADVRPGSKKKFCVWSAGCSSGEEPYTLAIVLNEYALLEPDFQYAILATDISTKVLEKARMGIYDRHLIAGIPFSLMQKYFLRNKDKEKKIVRVVPELRARISFQRVNLMDEQLMVSEKMDAIFCRNVIIYFERSTQQKLLRRLCSCLNTGGYLFLGHSETVHGFDLPLVRIASTIYRKVT